MQLQEWLGEKLAQQKPATEQHFDQLAQELTARTAKEAAMAREVEALRATTQQLIASSDESLRLVREVAEAQRDAVVREARRDATNDAERDASDGRPVAPRTLGELGSRLIELSERRARADG